MGPIKRASLCLQTEPQPCTKVGKKYDLPTGWMVVEVAWAVVDTLYNQDSHHISYNNQHPRREGS
jgi:hypothetical protein